MEKNDAWFSFAWDYGERYCLDLGAWDIFMALHSIEKMVEKDAEYTECKSEKFLGFTAVKELGLLSAYLFQT